MSLIYDWTEEGATPEERALLVASKNERPSASARTKTLAALGLGTVITATTVTATTTAAATTTAGVAFGTIGKIVAVVLVVGGASGGFAWHASQRSKHVVAVPAAKQALVSAPAEPPAPAPAASPPPSPEKADDGVAPPRSAVRSRAAAASPSANSLSLEVAALEKAHRAIAARDSAAALRALDRYHAQFPNGSLASEETVLRVQAALAQGDKSNAAALAKEFRANHPDSPYGKRVEDLVSNKATKP